MKYKCKMYIVNNMREDAWNPSFRIWVKYKPINNIFYKENDKFYIFNYDIYDKSKEYKLCDLLEEFNKMSTEELKMKIANTIKRKEETKIKELKNSNNEKYQINLAYQKVQEFIIEVE